MLKAYAAVQIYGGTLRGKTYSLLGILDRLTETNQNRPDVALMIDCKNNGLLNGLKKSFNKMKDDEIFSVDEVNEVRPEESNFAIKFIELLQKKNMRSFFAFDNVGPDDLNVIRSLINFVESTAHEQDFLIRIFVATLEKDVLFSADDVPTKLKFYQIKMQGYTEDDSLKYLSSDRPPVISYYRYVADDETSSTDIFTGKEDLAKYYDHNPGCLRLEKNLLLDAKPQL